MVNIEYFQLPIEFIDNKICVDPTTIGDLELLNTKDGDDKTATPIYDIVFTPSNVFSKETVALWSKYYTSDKKFLEDSKSLIKNLDLSSLKIKDENSKFLKMNDIYNEIVNETGFYEKYQYVDSSWFKWLNNKSNFLQILSLYNLTSPVISLILPIIFLIIPFFILKLTKVPIDMKTYLAILKQLFSRHPLGQVFLHFNGAPLDKKMYIAFTLAFYFFQIYQNLMACIRFYRNLYKIHNYLFELKSYIEHTVEAYDCFENQSKLLDSYTPFLEKMRENREIFNNFKKQLNRITPWKFNLYKLANIGQVMKCFYKLYDDKIIKNAITYSFGFHGYLDNIRSLKNKYNEKLIAACKFSKNKTKFKDAYFPAVIKNPIKNSYSLDKQLLITGPNAAGKTTLLKTTFFNILFSQQVGFGFYSSAQITPFDHLHCYLNIPDTSGRDSLFQAEARRCKNILTSIETSSKSEKHFCIFDELYSGTNPYEAISSAVSFLTYLNKHKNIKYILTTHFIDLCKKLENNKINSNHHMNIIENGNDFRYTYELKDGISTVKGGVKVLSDLEYPDEIINETKRLICEIKV